VTDKRFSKHASEPASGLSEQINALLPQTQCTKCGFQGCLPYAEAIATGEAINRCPPGGPETIQRLALLTGRPVQLLNPEVGIHTPLRLAVIREDECIGCTKCIQACPVDAIVGAARLMHTVITQHCTGCDLCVEPCPVDCIDMISVGQEIAAPSAEQSQTWKLRYQRRQRRLSEEARLVQARRLDKLKDKIAALDRGETLQRQSTDPATTALAKTPAQLRVDIEAAVARTRARKAALRNRQSTDKADE
jgi:Na+-translocating ferredoxin:NAD+ oxidoreductase subunit B